MADERYRWLDAEAAERLLSGEPPRAADPPAGDQAEQLAGVLRALSAPPPTAEDELPGEAAALAAFRTSRDERTGQADSAPHTGHGTGTGDSDVGLIRLHAPRTGRNGTPGGARGSRPARLVLAAALVAGMVGGTAVLAGTGLLRTPFDDSRSGPAGAATATHPQRPLISPPAQGVTPDDRHEDDLADGGRDGAQGGEDPGHTPGAPPPGDGKAAHGARWKLVVSACRSWHQGRPVNGERRRALHEAAGGASRVAAYCRGVTAKEGAGTKDGTAGKDDKGAGGGMHEAETRLDADEGEQRNTLPGQETDRPDTGDGGEGKGNNGSGKGNGKGKGNGGGPGNSGSHADDHPSKSQGNGNGSGKGNGNNSPGNGNGSGKGNGNGKQDQ
ncbi:hypothetical protein ACH4UX_32460 [Streptomyces althioticus]|uniref:hypothetical protein n=1 Tax=Streptomyces althioticus TaxID=83380 RepID=UPI0036F80260|nr:hypothetical protein OG872_12510 [Streptomyces althioticus]